MGVLDGLTKRDASSRAGVGWDGESIENSEVPVKKKSYLERQTGYLSRLTHRTGKAVDHAVGDKFGLDTDSRADVEKARFLPAPLDSVLEPYTTLASEGVAMAGDTLLGAYRGLTASAAETLGTLAGASAGDTDRGERDLNAIADLGTMVATGRAPSIKAPRKIPEPKQFPNPIPEVAEAPVQTPRQKLQGVLDGSATEGVQIRPEVRPEGLRGHMYDFADKIQGNKYIKKLTPLTDVPDSTLYKAIRGRTVGRIGETEDIAAEIQKTFSGVDAVSQQQVYRYLTTESPSVMIKDPHVRVQAVELAGMIDDVGKALVRTGKLTEETWQANRHTYLPRIYLDDVLKGKNKIGSTTSKSDGSYTKRRNENMTEAAKREKGEIKDPGFLGNMATAKPTRDIVVDDFLDTVARNDDWVNPASVAEYEGRMQSTAKLQQQATDKRALSTRLGNSDPETAELLLKQADDMEASILRAEQASTPPVKIGDYKKIPDNKVYGNLRGMEVRKGIHDDITHLYGGNEGLLNRWFYPSKDGPIGKGHRAWKMSKTVLNPPTHARNVMSNSILLNVVGGVPLRKIPGEMRGAVSDIFGNKGAFKVAKDYGLVDSTFTAQELTRFNEYAFLSDRGGMMGVWDRAKNVAGKGANKMADAYQFEEMMFKVARIRYGMKQGETPAEAAMKAQDALFDYSLVPKAVEGMRTNPITGSPFITYRYKAAGAMADSMLRHPERYLPYIGATYAMGELWAASNDLTEEETEYAMKMLPEWQRNSGTTYIMPGRDENGNLQPVDFGYTLPWGDFFRAYSTAGSGDIGAIFKETGLFGTPLSQITTGLLTNEDTFTGRDIVNPHDTKKDQLLSMMKYGWDLAAPTILNSRGGPAKMYDSYTNEIDRYGEPNLTMGQAALRNIGINVYPSNSDVGYDIQVRELKNEINETKSQQRYMANDMRLSEEEAAAENAKYDEIIDGLYEKLNELDGYKNRAEQSRKTR